MTIKRRLFHSNIRMVLVAIAGTMAAILVVHVVISIIVGTLRFPQHPDFEPFRSPAWGGFALAVFFTVFIILICISNTIITRQVISKITKSLDVLNRGVKQIHENNFLYRIEYHDNDEFRPVCETFNHMAAELEASTERRLKDETNRRELLAGISHDLRTPLTSILGYLEGLETGIATTSEMKEKYFHAIRNNAASMNHIIERLFLFSKLDMNDFPLCLHNVDIKCTIADIMEEIIDDYAERGLVITMANIPENIHVIIDTIFLRNALINILENSVKYKTKETGHMEISASILDNSIMLRFADDGPGLPADLLPKLFDVFYRADSSRNTKGSGLGLAITAKIIERAEGKIYAENIYKGGLAIVIELPIATKAA